MTISISIFSQDAIKNYFIGDSLLASGDREAAEEQFIISANLARSSGRTDFLISSLLNIARIRTSGGDIEKAKNYLDTVDIIFDEFHLVKNDSLYSNFLNRKAYLFLKTGQLVSSEQLYRNSAKIRDSIELFDYTLSVIYNNLGFIHSNWEDMVMASEYFSKAIFLRAKILGEKDRGLASPYSNLGAAKLKMGYLIEAEQALKLAEEIYIENSGPNYIGLGKVYVNRGTLRFKQSDYYNAERFLIKSIHILSSDLNNSLSELITAYDNLGLIYQSLEDFLTSETWFIKSLQLQDSLDQRNIAYTYNRMGNMYLDAGDKQKAEYYLLSGLQKLIEDFGEYHFSLGPIYLNMGAFYLESGAYPKGLEYTKKALDISIKNSGFKHPRTSRCLFNLAWAKKEQNQLDSALYYVQQSLIANVPQFHDLNYHGNPQAGDGFSGMRTLSSLKLKGDLLLEIFNTRDSDRDLLVFALAAYEAAVATVENIRFEYQTEESQLFLSENVKDLYLSTIQTAYRIYSETGDLSLKNKVFQYSEKSKSASLLAGMRGMEAMSFSGLPASLLELENSTIKELTFYREQLFEEKRLEDPNNLRIRLFEERIFTLSKQYDSVINTFESNYPDYYNLKYNTAVTNVEDLQKELSNSDLFIEYSVSDSLLTSILIGRSSYELFQTRIGAEFFLAVDSLYALITGSSFSENTQLEFLNFVNNSKILFKYLIDPFLEYIDGKDLTIVPDDVLSYLPFEVLLKTDNNVEDIDYKRLPYLIKTNALSYAYSATVLTERSKTKPGRSRKLLGIAPEYMQIHNQFVNTYSKHKDYREKLTLLPNAEEEIREICRLTSGHMLLDSDATETRFKEIAGNYDILHLAMHTIIDDTDPMYSKLVFSATSPDSPDDGFLNALEIYNLNLSASMTVLSSCRSGSGKIQRGEGVMSLARSFKYAGCPGILLTLWTTDDKSGGEIMTGFYSYLKKGYSRNKALQYSKIDFVESAGMLRSHPYFWSAYIGIGDTSPIYPGIKPKILLIVLVLIVIVIGMLLWRRSIKVH